MKSFFKSSIPQYSGRNSNIEFIRIFAMIMILMLHGIFREIGEPSIIQASSKPCSTFIYITANLICLCGVNLFILISGWFGIKVKRNSICKLLFQCFFILIIMYGIGIILGYTTFNIRSLLECFLIGDRAWFVKAYLALCILSPILNSFVQTSSKQQFKTILIIFFLFQTIYGSFSQSAKFILSGFSCFSFIGLYLLARYIRIYGSSLQKYGILIFLGSIIGASLWFYIPLRLGLTGLSYFTYSYVSPLIITEALGILLIATNIKSKTNKIINFFAASSFAVYLCHDCNTWTQDEYIKISSDILVQYHGLNYIIKIICFILSVYIGATVLDQIRKIFWEKINSIFLRTWFQY